MSNPGCTMMKCTDFKDGKCHYERDVCKYREPEPDEKDAEIERLTQQLAEAETSRQAAHNKCDELNREVVDAQGENYKLTRERDALRESLEGLVSFEEKNRKIMRSTSENGQRNTVASRGG